MTKTLKLSHPEGNLLGHEEYECITWYGEPYPVPDYICHQLLIEPGQVLSSEDLGAVTAAVTQMCSIRNEREFAMSSAMIAQANRMVEWEFAAPVCPMCLGRNILTTYTDLGGEDAQCNGCTDCRHSWVSKETTK